jgi:hypothetical protein
MYRERLRRFHRAASLPVYEYGPAHFYVTPQIVGELRVLSYLDQWRTALDRGWFHVRMEDHSLFLFNDAQVGTSYAFLQAPIVVETFREFLTQRGLEYTQKNRQAHAEDYELAISTATLRANVCPIRYDHDQVAYRAGVHPLAHLHIGLDNNVRIALRKCMSAEAFSLFVMRQVYPDCWARLLERSTPDYLHRAIRLSLDSVPAAFWGTNDEVELHLS